MQQITEQFQGNTSIRNRCGAFWLICEPEDPIHNAIGEVANDADLCSLQERRHYSGFVSVEVISTVYGFGLRNISNLGATFPAGRGRYKTFLEAVTAAEQWHGSNPRDREVVVRSDNMQAAYV